jgi:MFS family permease
VVNTIDVAALQRKTIRTLSFGQVLSGFGLGSTLSIGALLAADLSGSEAWSGSAATFSTLGAAVWAIPLARLAYRRGRRVALAFGAALAISGALLVITAASVRFFPLLLLALFTMGAGSAVGLQARFAAVDLPDQGKAGRDLSLVVWATTVGAVIGPNLFGPGDILGDYLGLPPMTGPFMITIAAQISASTVFFFGLRPDPLKVSQELAPKNQAKPKVSIKTAFDTLRAYPKAAYAVISIALSHMVMVSVMSMTPVHMKHDGATLSIVGFIISVHIAGMYAFSPAFGWLADKLGRIQTVIAGQLIYIASLFISATAGHNHDQITLGLFLLGLGWSASTVGGSALLTATLPPQQKTNVQGLSDSSMQLSGAIGGAIAGTILAAVQFEGLNFVALTPVAIVLALSGFALLGRERTNP